MTELKRTPLFPMHQKYGAKLVAFNGWEMPVQYAGILVEHRAVRTAAGLFDVSHMGELVVAGPQALDVVQKVITNDAGRLADGQALYSPMCYPDGGTVDDVLVYRMGPQRYLLVVNAGNVDKDHAWIRDTAAVFPDARVEDESGRWAQLAVQGPAALSILSRLTATDLAGVPSYCFRPDVEVAGVRCLASRTGYTGEDGFELYCAAGDGLRLWEALLEEGDEDGLQPCGLGARDTLRLEARLPLYGHELDEQTTPLEAGLGRFVKFRKPDYHGKAALQRQQAEGLRKRLVGFELTGRGVPRQGYPIAKDGATVGVVTSGTLSPTLNKPLGLGYVPPDLAEPGCEFDVLIRGSPVPARVVKTPFYQRPR